MARRLKHRWCILLGLVLGGSAWWGLGWWLEPKPLWRISFDSQSQKLVPLAEDRELRWLICDEFNSESHSDSSSLVVIDSRSGEIKHRLRTSIPVVSSHTSNSASIETFKPRIFNDVIYRFAEHVNEQGKQLELRAWHFKQKSQEEILHTWRFSNDDLVRVTWEGPESRIFLIQTLVPLDPSLALKSLEPWTAVTSALALHPHDRHGIFQRSGVTLCQTWEISGFTKSPVRILAHWSLPAFRWSADLALSADHGLLAIGEPLLNLPIFQSPTPVGYTCFVEPRGILVYNASTGELQNRLLADGGWLSPRHWLGAYLVSVQFCMTVEKRTQATNNGTTYQVETDLDEYQEWHISKSLPLTHALTGKRLHWLSESKGLVIVVPCSNNSSINKASLSFFERANPVFEKETVANDQVFLQHRFRLSENLTPNGPSGSTMRVMNDQLIVYRVGAMPEVLHSLTRDRPWFKEWATELFPPVETISMIDMNSGKIVWTHSGQCRQAYDEKYHLTNLLVECFQYVATPYADHAVKVHALEFWKLPLRVYSLWWARCGGIAVFLLFWLLLRRISWNSKQARACPTSP